MKNRLLAIALTVFTLVSTFSGNHFVFAQEVAESEFQESGTEMSVDENGDIEITRMDVGNTPMGEDGTWTIFVYVCGSDLETGKNGKGGGFATQNIQQMIKANTDENIKFIVQTGGAKKWQDSEVNADKIERWEICGGEKRKVYTAKKYTSMGETKTLSSFLKWGVENYPASKMGVVLWNHGGGCISGVCFDEKKNYDCLSLAELDTAFKTVSKEMSDKFEFIGLDACLMSTIEVANVLAPYARYMISSEDYGYAPGWDYYAMAHEIKYDPALSGKRVGQVIVDSYYKATRGVRKAGYKNMTMSVVDLAKVDKLIDEFNIYSKKLSSALDDSNCLAQFAQNIATVDSFGHENPDEGYYNLIDMEGFIGAGEEFVEGEEDVYDAMNEAVVCYANGLQHEKSGGISIYYPLANNGESEMQAFKSLCVSPYYYAIARRINYGQKHNGSMQGYEQAKYVNAWIQTQKEGGKNYIEPEWRGSDALTNDNASDLVEYNVEPSIYNDWEFWRNYFESEKTGRKEYKTGKFYGFIPTSRSEKNIVDVRLRGELLSVDGKYWIQLGEKSMKAFNKHFGYAINLDEEQFFFLPTDEVSWITGVKYQPVSTYLYEIPNTEDEKKYYSYFKVNGADKTVDIDRKNYLSYISGNFNSEGVAERIEDRIEEGDVITPICGAINIYSGEYEYIYGDDVLCGLKTPKVGTRDYYDKRDNKLTYRYYYDITDIFGNHTLTNYVYCIPGEKYWK